MPTHGILPRIGRACRTVFLMPTYGTEHRWRDDVSRLTEQQLEQFLSKRDEFVDFLLEWEARRQAGTPRFSGLFGVKRMVGQSDIMEFAWAADGRCTWRYGLPILEGKVHIIWRRIGTHDIYDDP